MGVINYILIEELNPPSMGSRRVWNDFHIDELACNLGRNGFHFTLVKKVFFAFQIYFARNSDNTSILKFLYPSIHSTDWNSSFL